MSLYFERFFIKFTVVVFVFVLCFLNQTDYRISELSISYEKVIQDAPVIPANCWCSDKNGNKYNFCYINPNNSTMIGRRFDCKHIESVIEMDLFDMDYIDLTRQEMPEPQFVTAISDNHIAEGRKQLKNLHSLWPNKTIVVFDMGLGVYRKEYESDPLVDLRNFPFDRYPAYVNKLFEYRWKPIIIAKMLQEFGAVFYFDTSLIFYDSDLSPVYNLLRCKNKNSRAAETVSRPKYLKTQDFDALLKTCDKSSYLFHSFTYHSIFAATQAGMYDFLPINMNITKSVKMAAATVATVVKTKEAVENIVKWSVLCAFEESCMGPPGAQLDCEFKPDDVFNTFANCHRYDQSAVNILSANLFNGNVHNYGSDITGYLYCHS